MNCKEANKRFLEAAETKLNAAEETAFSEHLKNCDDCAKLYKDVIAVYMLTETKSDIEPRAFFAESVMNRLEDGKRQDELAYDRLFMGYFRKLALTGAAFVLGLILFFYVTEGTVKFNFFGEDEEAASRSVTELLLDNFN